MNTWTISNRIVAITAFLLLMMLAARAGDTLSGKVQKGLQSIGGKIRSIDLQN